MRRRGGYRTRCGAVSEIHVAAVSAACDGAKRNRIGSGAVDVIADGVPATDKSQTVESLTASRARFAKSGQSAAAKYPAAEQQRGRGSAIDDAVGRSRRVGIVER